MVAFLVLGQHLGPHEAQRTLVTFMRKIVGVQGQVPVEATLVAEAASAFFTVVVVLGFVPGKMSFESLVGLQFLAADVAGVDATGLVLDEAGIELGQFVVLEQLGCFVFEKGFLLARVEIELSHGDFVICDWRNDVFVKTFKRNEKGCRPRIVLEWFLLWNGLYGCLFEVWDDCVHHRLKNGGFYRVKIRWFYLVEIRWLILFFYLINA